jgi:hypothetical protein
MPATRCSTWLPLLLAGASLSAQQPPAWTDAGVTNGVALAYRDNATLDAREVRATAELAAPVERIFTSVCDFSTYKSWLDGIEEARLISGTLPADYEFYFRYASRDLIVASRDVAMHVQSGPRENGAAGCHWSEIAGRVPEQRGVVRMLLHRGSWTIEPMPAGKSRVIYQVAVRPGGSVPDWLVRRGALAEIPDVIERLRRRLDAK